ncbi:hypothetical protein [Clostridium beijerinckii]|jgi:FOG: Glucan-binding domain (YG repeat)|uniref:Uncharacterized protein n=1 Tax=Clostridium beijerinckii TaxID=1520 RepID=A0A1S8RZ25_CLOBE|nr:hypothetical protein [Clostridium beijerinckii]NRY61528.1 glucan-binding YG repeat protein [Clostridium beijerinckii]OOM58471.1 hypothetical protein CLBCK_40490 [Clostridium beijerinckii]
MKKIKLRKIITSTLVLALILALKPVGANADTYEEYMTGYKIDNNHQIRFLKQDETYARSEWIHKVGYSPTWGKYDLWNYFGDDCLRKEEWFNVDGKWYYEVPYYEGDSGYLGGIAVNREIDGCFLGSDGAMIENSWGTDINRYWYYAGPDGKILKNTITPDGYKVDKDGRWIR